MSAVAHSSDENPRETLLEMSERFKATYPERDAKNAADRQRRLQECLGIFSKDELIDSIHEKIAQKMRRKREEEECRRNMPPLLNLRFRFAEVKDDHEQEQSKVGEFFDDLFESDHEYVTTFYKEDPNEHQSLASFFRSHQHHKNESNNQLTIVVACATNLHKWVDEEHKLRETKVTCEIHPDSQKYGPKLVTKYKRPNFNRVTRWGHIFVIRGFTMEDWGERMLSFAIDAHTEDGKRRLGYLNMTRQGCMIGPVSEKDAKYCNNDPDFWINFLNNPKEAVNLFLPLYPSDSQKKCGDTSTFIRTVANTIKRTASRRRKHISC